MMCRRVRYDGLAASWKTVWRAATNRLPIPRFFARVEAPVETPEVGVMTYHASA